jgi:hypothetical protein
MQFIAYTCRIVLFVGLASLPLSAQQTATVTGHVSGVVAVSVGSPARVLEGDAQVSAQAAGVQHLVLSLSGTRGGETRIDIPVQLRSNVGVTLMASCTTSGATLSAFHVAEVGGAGAFVYPDALGRVEVTPAFDGRPGTRAPRSDRPELSSPVAILSAPPISMGGTLDSPGNMVEVVLRVVLTAPQSAEGWRAELKVSATRRAGAQQSVPSGAGDPSGVTQ